MSASIAEKRLERALRTLSTEDLAAFSLVISVIPPERDLWEPENKSTSWIAKWARTVAEQGHL